MALNLWKLGGQPTSYNPLSIGWNNFISLKIGDYILSFRAKSSTGAQLRLGGDNSNININGSFEQRLNLNGSYSTYSFPIKVPDGQRLFFTDTNSIGDIIIDSITLVQKPLPKLTINGLDGFLSGKWTTNGSTNFKAIDDANCSFLPTAQWGLIQSPKYPCLPNTTYTLSIASETGNGSYMQVNFFDINGNTITNVSNTDNHRSIMPFTAPSNCYFIQVLFVSMATSGWDNVTVSKPMLNVGNVPAPYESKKGDRMVMPTAKKNLWVDGFHGTARNINGLVYVNGKYSFTSLSSYQSDWGLSNCYNNILEKRILVKKDDIFTISADGTFTYIWIAERDSSGATITSSFNGSTKQITYKIQNSNVVHLEIVFGQSNPSTYTEVYNIQVEKNGFKTPFTPYAVQTNKLPQKYVPKKNLTVTDIGGWEQGGLNGDGSLATSTIRLRNVSFISVNPNTTYALSMNSNYEANYVDFVGGVGSFGSSWITNGAITTRAGATQLKLTIRRKDGANILPSEISTIQPQLEQNSTATPYEPYQLILPKRKTGLSFNGVTDYISFGNQDSVNFTGDFTISFLGNIKRNSNGILGKRNGGSSGNWWRVSSVADGLNLEIAENYGGTGGKISASSSVPINKFNELGLFTFVVKLIGGTVKIISYFNGLIVSTYDTTYSSFNCSNVDAFEIGRWSTYYCPIDIKNFCAYKRALSDSEVFGLYNKIIPSDYSVYYDFENAKTIVGNTVIPNAQNLIPSFEDARWNIHANAKVLGKDVLHLDAVGAWQSTYVDIPFSNQNYYFTWSGKGFVIVRFLDSTKTQVNLVNMPSSTGAFVSKATAPVGTSYIRVELNNDIAGSYDFIRPQLYKLSGQEGTINGAPIPLNKPSKRSKYALR